MVFTETIIPWILGTLLLLITFTFGVAVKSWRDMKRSPYFFMRRQAEKRLQTYLSTSLVLLFVAFGVGAYAWRSPVDNNVRVAVLVNAKPPQEEIVKLIQSSPESADAATLVKTLETVQTTTFSTNVASFKPVLPPEFDQFEPIAELKEDTELGSLTFSPEIDERYQAVDPGRIFAEGYYTLYATFSYAGMEDGMAWAWVWRHNGEVVEGGNELWDYGDEGPGYIYLNPEEGFQPGEYSLDVWVNGELLTRSAITINNSAISAGN